MKQWVGIAVGVAVAGIGCRSDSKSGAKPIELGSPRIAAMRQMPLAFEPFGSTSNGFLTRGPGYMVHLDSRSAMLTLREATAPQPRHVVRRDQGPSGRRAAVRMRLVGAVEGSPSGEDILPGVTNYLVGPPEDWRIAVPTYRRAVFERVYSGVDVIYYGAANGHLEFDFRLRAGAKHTDIRLDFDGAEEIAIENKRLLIRTAAGELRLEPPVAYQEGATGHVPVRAAFRRLAGGQIGFDVGPFDHSRTLIIDPVLDFSTVFGGNFGQDLPLDLAVDAAGSAYVVGDTSSSDYPTSVGSLDTSYGGGTADGFVTKFAASGAEIVYSTFFGGSGYDRISGIALDPDGNAYLTGFTTSPNFPVVGGLQPVPGGDFDSFVAKLDVSGSALAYSTFLGGSDYEEGTGITVDATRAAVVTGYVESSDYPVTAGALQASHRGPADAFVTKLAPDGGSLQFSTFLGGGFVDSGSDIAMDSVGRIFVTGKTLSSDFPTHLALQPTFRGTQSDAFVTVLTPNGSGFHYSTYLGAAGGGDDQADAIAVAPDGSAVVTGITQCANTGFPIVAAFQPVCGGGPEAFVTKIAPDGQRIVFSSFLGGAQLEWGQGIGFGAGDSVWLTGRTVSPDFPTRDPLFTGALSGGNDAYVAHVSSDGATLLFSTFLEGTTEGEALALSGDAAYVAGIAGSEGFLVKIVDVSARPDAYSTDEDVLLTVPAPGVLANDEGVTSVSLVTAPAHAASFSLASDGSFLYFPAGDFSGTDTFSYRASNGSVDTAPATVTLTIAPGNDAPDAVADAFSAFEDSPLVVATPGVLSNDRDPDEDDLSAVLLESPLSGAVTLAADGSFVYAPELDFTGTDSFTYLADDGASQSAPATVTITVASVNDPPAASPDSYSTDEDTPLVVATATGTLANDSDPEGDSLQAQLVSGPSSGTLTFSASGEFTYTPFANFFGTDSFRYAASDASSASDPATVTLTIAPVNDAVVPESDSFAATEDSSLNVEVPGVLGNDTDPDGDALAVMLASPPSNGTLSLAADGSFVYSPDTNFFGTDTFTYTVGDGATLSEPITVTLSVAPGAPDPPLTQSDSYTIEEDGVLSAPAETGVLANDSDPEQTGLTATLIDPPAEGSLSFAASGAFTFEPPPDFHGSTSFTYSAQNDSFSSAAITVTLSVTPQDDIPVASSEAVTTDQSISTTIPVLANDTGLGDKPISLLASAPANGTTVVNADLTITYKPALHFAGQDGFSYTVTDVDGQSSSAWVTVTINPAQLVGSSYYGVSADDVIAYLPHDDFGNTACFDFENNDFVEGATSGSAFVSCGSLESGPVAEVSINLGAQTWRVDARVAASQGNSEHEAGTYSLGYAQDTYTVLQGTSQVPADTQVPLFLRLHRKLDIQNAPYIFLTIHPQIKRLIGDGQATNFYNTGTSISNDLLEDEFMDIPLPSVAFGTRFRALWILTAIAESGGAPDSLIDPKVIDASVEFSLCSTTPGVVIQGASGAIGNCGGDLILHHLELVQAVSHDPQQVSATDLVSDKPTVMLVEVENTFSGAVEATIEAGIDQGGPSLTTLTTEVVLPPNCRKRFYLPEPDGANDRESCQNSPTASTLAAVGLQPVEGGGPVQPNAIVSATSPLVETTENNALPRPGAETPPQEVRTTSLRIGYVRVFCAAGDPCKTDPANYGDVSDAEYADAVFWSNLHTRSMFPVGPVGFAGSACRNPDQSPCEIDGSPDKCVLAPCPDVPEEDCGTCAGADNDAKRAFEDARFLDPFIDRAVAIVPSGYYAYHNLDTGDSFAAGYAPLGSAGITVLAAAEAGSRIPGIHVPVAPHELGHSYGFQHPPIIGSGEDAIELFLPPAGYWVGCPDAPGYVSTLCEIPELSFDEFGARELMARARAGFFEPPRRWIHADHYETLLTELKLDPDPAVLFLSGTVTRDLRLTIDTMASFPEGKVDAPLRGTTIPDLFRIVSLDSAGNVISSHVVKGGFRVELENGRILNATSTVFMQSIAFPLETAKIRFVSPAGETRLEIDVAAGLLRNAVERIPDQGFTKNPKERRKTLLNKVDAFEKLIAEGKRDEALAKLRSDLRDKAVKWLVDFQQRSRTQTTKSGMLGVIDTVEARLEHQSGLESK